VGALWSFTAAQAAWKATPPPLASDGVNEVVSLAYPLLSNDAQAHFFRVVVGLP
jgi:hypothetical protein